MIGALVGGNSDGCSAFNLRDQHDESGFPAFVFLEGGECNNRVKALNAQNAGARLAIIADESREATQHDYSSSGSAVNIPVLFVTEALGEKISHTIKTTGSIFLVFEMAIPKRDVVAVEYHLNDRDHRLFQMVGAFKSYAQQFEERLEEKIHLFKAAPEDSDKVLTQESFACVPRRHFHDFVALFAERCAAEVLINSGCQGKLIKHFDQSLMSSFKSCVGKINEKSLLDSVKTRSLHSKGYITINGFVYHGSYKPENLFEAICGAFVHSPNNCLYLNNKFVADLKFSEYKKSAKNKFWSVWILVAFGVIALLAVIGAGMSAIFKKIYSQILSERLPEMVRESVTSYQSIKNND